MAGFRTPASQVWELIRGRYGGTGTWMDLGHFRAAQASFRRAFCRRLSLAGRLLRMTESVLAGVGKP